MRAAAVAAAALAASSAFSAVAAPADDVAALIDLAGRVAGGENPTARELQPLENVRRAAADALGMDPDLEFDLDAVAAGIKMIRMVPFNENGWADGAGLAPAEEFTLDPERLARIVKLVVRASAIVRRVAEREAAHREELAKRGVAEVPPSKAACRFRMEAGADSCLFDKWGELYVDRRFVTKEELKTVERLEDDYRRVYAGSGYAKNPKAERRLVRRSEAMKSAALPVFRGFEDDRYQRYDEMILALTADFNAHKADWIGGSASQAAGVADLSPAQVKSHMIEETGGNDRRSLAAWAADPLQVNVPGDWDEAKAELGLRKPAKRNEGELEANVRAAVKFLARKGFGISGRPARVRPKGFFDGWQEALRRYNGRRDRTEDGRYYSDAYAGKVLRRAGDADLFVPIEIKLAK